MSTFYVSANATSNGVGSIENPFQLQTAFNGASGKIKPGDTVLLRGGVYKGLQTFPDFGNTSFAVRVRGTAAAPIIFKAYPKERVTIDNQDPVTPPPYLIGGKPYENNMTIAFFQSTCNDVQLWNCEIRCSSTLSREYNLPRGGIYITAGDDIYLFLDDDEANWYKRVLTQYSRSEGENEDFEIWKINIKGMKLKKDFTLNSADDNQNSAFYTNGPIPRNKLRLMS